MTKEYVFKFQGTKEMFLNTLSKFPNNEEKFYYFNGYIIKLICDEIHIGINGSHSGGYWFIPTITELDDGIQFSGTIQCIHSNKNQSVLITKLNSIISKVNKRANYRDEISENRLFDLMENYLNCIRL